MGLRDSKVNISEAHMIYEKYLEILSKNLNVSKEDLILNEEEYFCRDNPCSIGIRDDAETEAWLWAEDRGVIASDKVYQNFEQLRYRAGT